MKIHRILKRAFQRYGERLNFVNDGVMTSGFSFVQPYRKGLDRHMTEADEKQIPAGRAGHGWLVLTASHDCELYDSTIVIRRGKKYAVRGCCEVPGVGGNIAYIWALIVPIVEQADNYVDFISEEEAAVA